MMRGKRYAWVATLCSFMIAAVGCGQTNQAAQDSKQPVSSNITASNASKDNNGGTPLTITLAGGSSSGGFWGPIGEGIGEAIKRSIPGSTFTYSPGQDGANVITVTTGKTQLGIVTVPAAKWALEGKPPFSSKIDKVRAIAFLHPQPYHFIVTEDSGIKSIEQIAKENYPLVASVNTKNSPMEISNQIVFKSYGTSYEQIEKNGGKIQYIAASRVNDQVKDNKIQSLISPMPAPAGSIVELNTSKPLRMLPLSEQAIKQLEEELGAKPTVMKAGTYEFVKEDVPTVSVDTILITSADVPEDVIYQVTKAMYEQLDYLHTVHKSLENLSKETIKEVANIPLHPGAEKFYKEVGIIQ